LDQALKAKIKQVETSNPELDELEAEIAKLKLDLTEKTRQVNQLL
jgi:hypothetical protein